MTKKKDEEQKAKEVKPVEQTERTEQNSVAPENTPSAEAPEQEGAKPPEDTPGTPPTLETLKPTAVASGSEQIAETAGAVELASPRMDTPLERLEVLADRHRVPTWQQAALCRLMGWADGKAVSNAEYVDVLDRLKTRRVGGGRVE